MDQTNKNSKEKQKDLRKKRVEEIGSTLAQIKARVKANKTCARKDDEAKTPSREILSEKSEKYIQVLELDKAKAQQLERDRPKIKEAIENLLIDRENQKLVEKKIEQTRAKQSVPLPEIPAEVQKRISDLEITIHNLKENLSEKERVLESKTESWRLLSDQLEQRNIEVVERYDVMAKEISEVKARYAEQETILRTELEKCKAKLQESTSLLISQENSKQEEEDIKSELDKLKTEHSECETKIAGEHRLCLKLQAKIKSYRTQISNNKELTSEVERLKNEIATLEDEKESSVKNKEKINEMEAALKSLESDLSEAREQCGKVNQEYAELSSKLEEKEDTIKMLKESLESMEQSKISSEFKAAELEEKLESEDRAQSDKMSKEMDNLKKHVKQQDETVKELRTIIEQKEDEIRNIKDGEFSFSYDTQDLKDLLEEWKEKYSRIEETVRKVEEDKETLADKVISLQTQLDTMNSKSDDLIHELKEKESNLKEYVSKNELLLKELNETNKKLGEHQNGKSSQEQSKADDQTHKLKKLAANLKIKVKLCKELEDKVTELTEKLQQNENDKMDLENALGEYKIKLENVQLDSDVVESMKNLLSEKEIIIQRLMEQQSAKSKVIQRVRTESQCEIVEKETEIKHLKEENLMLESKLNENLMEIHCVDEKMSKDEIIESLNQRILHLNDELENKVKIINELGLTIEDLTKQMDRGDAREQLEQERRFVQELRVRVDELLIEKESLGAQLSEKNELGEKVKALESELNNSREVITKKEEIITHFEKEINNLKHDLASNEVQMNKIQELYVEEYNKKDGLLTNIETEMNLSKNEILILTDQLAEVTQSFESTMEKMKEKDDYIAKLENDLEEMKSRVEILQSSIDERQKSMEQKAHQLGEKLNQAANISSNFEHYRHETQQKLAKFEEIEKSLNFKINELTQDIEILKASNEELIKFNENLETSKKLSETKVSELETELSDIKTAYNTTLDQIEMLNEELKQVMAQIEFRNQELVRISAERNELVGKLTELEGNCGELRCQLQRYEVESESLKTELDCKLKELDVASNEISSLQSQLGCQVGDDKSDQIGREVEELKKEYEQRLRELQVEKEDLIRVIQGSVAQEVDQVVSAAQIVAEQSQSSAPPQQSSNEEIKVFTWEGQAESVSTDEFHDDGWGWNPSEAKLEEEYQNSESKTKQLENEIEKLKSENSSLLDEIKTVKIKCSKLVAKVKELKAKEESKNKNAGFDDLSFALQEEMRSQVDEMEKKNKELQNEIGSVKTERERLMKRVETLTSANNQLIEMKERQDIEVQVWQRNCAELKNQLQSFDWAESENKPKSVMKEPETKTDSQLEDKITFLETENEELMQIISSLKDEKQANNNLLVELNNIKEENKILKERTTNNEELKVILENERTETQNRIKLVEQLTLEKNNLEAELSKVNEEYQACILKFNTLSNEVNCGKENKNDYELLKSNLESKENEIKSFVDEISKFKEILIREREEFGRQCGDKDDEISSLKEKLSQLDLAVQQVQEMQNEQMQLSSEVERLQGVIQSLSQDNSSILSSYEIKVAEVEMLKADMKMLESCKDSAINDLESLREEMNQKFGSKSEAPACSVFSANAEPSQTFENKTQMFNMASNDQGASQFFNMGPENSSAPIPIDKQKESVVAASPPVFRGFFSDQNDPFSSIQQQFEDPLPINLPTFQESKNYALHATEQHADSITYDSLKTTVSKLEDENSNLIKKIEELSGGKEEVYNLNIKIAEKEKEIDSLNQQILQLSEQIRLLSSNVESEKGQMFANNQELSAKLREYEMSLNQRSDDLQKIQFEFDEFRKFHSNELERIKNESKMNETTQFEAKNEMESLRRYYEEQMREKELNHQNILLNKEEENAHLICEKSAKQAQLDKLSKDIDECNSKITALEVELKNKNEESLKWTSEINNMKQDLDRVNFENSELRKVKENDNQLYGAQVDYLQQSVQEKDASIENLQSTCAQLQQQISTLHEQLRVATERSSYLETCYSTLNATHTQACSDLSALEDRLRVADGEIERLSLSLTTSNQQLSELRSSVEQQKLTTETERSKEMEQVLYLTNEVEILQSAITEKDLEIERLSKLLTGIQEKLIKVEESKVTDEVSRLSSKLDESLYTLHLRDVRCDELTVEIMQLLEERDSLQLRLSEAIRENEMLKSQDQPPFPSSDLQTTLPLSKSTQHLTDKIGELHTGYMKTPTVQMDRENRYTQQMNLFTSASGGTEQGVIPIQEQVKKQQEQSNDYGILNWFFSSSTAPQSSQEPAS